MAEQNAVGKVTQTNKGAFWIIEVSAKGKLPRDQ